MCTVVHLEPEDFARELVHNPKNVYARTYVLDCGLAVVIYMCQDSHFLYYLDRPDCSKEKKDMLKSMDFYELHAEIYRKVNLDNRLRERQKNPGNQFYLGSLFLGSNLGSILGVTFGVYKLTLFLFSFHHRLFTFYLLFLSCLFIFVQSYL